MTGLIPVLSGSVLFKNFQYLKKGDRFIAKINIKIDNASKTDYLDLIEIWERSVRATHDFLPEENIKTLKPLILKHYFDAVDLRVAKNEHNIIVGFIGVAESNIEMLFISPEYRNHGIGSLLLKNSIEHQAAFKVDVNVQNPAAIGFYKYLGFKEVGSSPIDGQGNPFPLLHMEL
ncbi:MAG: GNAT family N-acetyltransferase [Colwelliaceae bacterium]|nr:GNAT family N-acetyltransferase [Colwelliaceae bacterium]